MPSTEMASSYTSIYFHNRYVNVKEIFVFRMQFASLQNANSNIDKW